MADDDDEAGPGRRYTKEAKKVFACRVPERDYWEAMALAKRLNTSISDVYRAAFKVATRVGKLGEPDS